MNKYRKIGSFMGFALLGGMVIIVPFISTSCGSNEKEKPTTIIVLSDTYDKVFPYIGQPTNEDLLNYAKQQSTVLNSSGLTVEDFDWSGTNGSNAIMTVKSTNTYYTGSITINYLVGIAYSQLTSSDRLKKIVFTGIDTNVTVNNTAKDSNGTGVWTYGSALFAGTGATNKALYDSSNSEWATDESVANYSWDKTNFTFTLSYSTMNLNTLNFLNIPTNSPLYTAAYILRA